MLPLILQHFTVFFAVEIVDSESLAGATGISDPRVSATDASEEALHGARGFDAGLLLDSGPKHTGSDAEIPVRAGK